MVGVPLFSCIISYQGEYGRKMPNIYAYGKNLLVFPMLYYWLEKYGRTFSCYSSYQGEYGQENTYHFASGWNSVSNFPCFIICRQRAVKINVLLYCLYHGKYSRKIPTICDFDKNLVSKLLHFIIDRNSMVGISLFSCSSLLMLQNFLYISKQKSHICFYSFYSLLVLFLLSINRKRLFNLNNKQLNFIARLSLFSCIIKA